MRQTLRSIKRARLLFKITTYKKTLRDIHNGRQFGPNGPQSDEALFVDPWTVKYQLVPEKKPKTRLFTQDSSGLVLDGDWDLAVTEISKTRKYQACQAHFVDGKSWEETGIYDHMMSKIANLGIFDKCRTMDDVIARYASIDRLYDELSKHNRLKRQHEMPQYWRREFGSIFGHVDRHGNVIRYRNGNHRFLITRILKYPEVPIHVGTVHLDAVKSGAYAALRQSIYD